MPSDEVLRKAWLAGAEAVQLHTGVPHEDQAPHWNEGKLAGMRAVAEVLLGMKSKKRGAKK